MGEFPSGQRGQTVNLLSVTSVVRIHLPPPKGPISYGCRTFLHHFAVFAFLGKYVLPYNQLPVVGPKVFVYLFWQFVSSRGSSPFDPHHDPHNEMRGNIQRAPERTTLSGALWRSCFLHDLCHEVSHLLRSISLHLPCRVRISAKGKACIAMSEHTADRFHVHTVLEC